MDFHSIFLRNNQKTNMGHHIPQSYAFNPISFGGQIAGLHYFAKGQIPFKSFSYPDCYSKLNIPPQNMFNNTVTRIPNSFLDKGFIIDNSPQKLTCTVKEVVGPYPSVFGASQTSVNNPLELLSDIVNKSTEILRTSSCPDAIIYCSPVLTSSKSKSQEPNQFPKQDFNKMSYAEVAKMNLSKLNKNIMDVNKPLDSNTMSSHRNNIFGVKKDKKKSSPQFYEYVNRNYGTNSTRGDQLQQRNKYHHKNNRRPHWKNQSSIKRELGTKKNIQNVDLDGSIWGRDNVEIFEDCPPCCPEILPMAPSIRVRSISSESDCSSEVSETLKNPPVRSISECSANSIDSDDSFIVFDDCGGDGMDDSYEEDSSDEDDERSPVTGNCNVLQHSDYLKCINSKWDNLTSKNIPSSSNENLKVYSQNKCSLSPCNALKKVRFACGEALAKVRKLCVWDYAHRAARIGPWEQAARDRSRFSSRISSLAPTLNPVLDQKHRSNIYDQRFAST